jgi:hypothetical protein
MNDSRIAKTVGVGLPLAGMAALLILSAVMFSSQKADANAAMAQKTGKGCPVCHTTAPALNDAGKKYKKTGKI